MQRLLNNVNTELEEGKEKKKGNWEHLLKSASLCLEQLLEFLVLLSSDLNLISGQGKVFA